MVNSEILSHLFNLEQLVSVLGTIPVVFLLTEQQIKAIMDRDQYQCQFPYPHHCSGNLSIHHILGKKDSPSNLITLCKAAHFDLIHKHGANGKQIIGLEFIASEQTEKAKERGWNFPEE